MMRSLKITRLLVKKSLKNVGPCKKIILKIIVMNQEVLKNGLKGPDPKKRSAGP